MKLSLFALSSFVYQVVAQPSNDFSYAGIHQKCCINDGGSGGDDLARRLELEGKDNPLCLFDHEQDIPGFTCIDSQETCFRRGQLYSPNINLFACGDHDEYCCRKCIAGEAFCDCSTGDCLKVELDTHWSCTMADYPTGTFFCGFGEACKLFPSGCQGDPHFKGWTGESFDFMGECDLNFLSHPEFNQGLGMNMQLRTTIRGDYSYIESVALEIGGDVLEVGSYGVYFYNGVENADLVGVMMGDQCSIEHITKDNKHSEFKITIQAEVGETIVISNVKDLVSVLTNNATFVSFGTSQGMMGDFRTGTFSARDGTVMKQSEPDAFAFEWQVRDTEKNLFQTVRAPQYPTQCVMPSKDASAVSRRLGQAGLAPADAEAACAKVQDDKTTFENCVYDVMATGDIDAAATYV